jgi:carbon monoxide dehydrogenase subunit G
MELTNEFRVAVPMAEAWAVLTDVERIAPCMPGAQLLEVEGAEYRGTVKVKVGPITATYRGAASFVEQDEQGGRAVLRAEGREARGQGNASALITATLSPDGEGTAVRVVTDLTVTGRVAQFGRGVLADVSAKLLDQFVACLEETVLARPVTAASMLADGGGSPAAEPAAAPSRPARGAPEIPGVPSPTEEPIGGTEWEEPDAEAADRTVTPPVPDVSGNGAVARPADVRRIESAPAEAVDLLGTASGPVAKRAVPAVGALVVVLWLFRRRRRRRRRS